MFSKEVAARVPRFFNTLAICFAGLGIACVILVKRNPNYIDPVSYRDEDKLTIKEALRDKTFHLALLMDFLTILPMIYMAGTFKTMAI